MEVVIAPGKYVVAVSGGVDSMVLLDVLSQQPDVELVVAHFDHGIRDDSSLDEQLVRTTAERRGLPYKSTRVELGQGASEAAARQARYDFLRIVLNESQADKIVTAHHQDDLLETMILNMLRGTGRQGLTPLRSQSDILRPLLHMTKQDLLAYAQQNGLTWREDSTNYDITYRRNYVRHKLMPKLVGQREILLRLHEQARTLNADISEILLELDKVVVTDDGALFRRAFVRLPHAAAAEYMHHWLTSHGVEGLDAALVHKAVIAAKTLAVGKKIDLSGGRQLYSGATSLTILPN